MKKFLLALALITLPTLAQTPTQISGSQIRNEAIENKHIKSTAAIGYAKINFTGIPASLVNAESPLTFVLPLTRTSNTLTLSTVPLELGGTGLTSVTIGHVLFGAGPLTPLATSSSFFWDNTNSRLGLGTASPSFLLDVNGAARIVGLTTTGTLKVTSSPSAGYTLVSDASGVATWTNPATAISSVSGWTKVSTTVSPSTPSDKVSIPGTLNLNTIDYTFPATQSVGAFLKTNGTGTLTWTTLSSGDLPSIPTTSVVKNIVTKTASYPATTTDYTIIVNATIAPVIITLPDTPTTGQELHIKKIDSTSNAVVITRGGSALIDGLTSVSIDVQWTSYTLQYDGTNWFLL